MSDDHITIDDIMGAGGHAKRPDHADYWILSDIILKLKAQMAEAANPTAQEEAWRAAYDSLGDFDSIAYCAIQAAIQTAGYETGADLQAAFRDPAEHRAYVRSVQTFFDGFKMGAEFVKRKAAL